MDLDLGAYNMPLQGSKTRDARGGWRIIGQGQIIGIRKESLASIVKQETQREHQLEIAR